MADVVAIKEAQLLDMWTNYTGTRGAIDKIGIYGSVNEGAQQLIDSAKTITWADSTSMTADVVFDIPANTVVSGVMLFDSSDLDSAGVYNINTDPYFDYNFAAKGESSKSYTNQGLLTVTSMSLGVQ